MYLSTAQEAAINHGFKVLGLRGVSIFGSSGDGGSHFSFGPFSGFGDLPSTLNDLSCSHTIPVFPTASPYIISVGGSSWGFFANPAKPVAWSGSGGGFSLQYAAPAHQKTTVAKYLQTAGSGLPAASSYNASNRAYPDISAVAEDGTSESCPTIVRPRGWRVVKERRFTHVCLFLCETGGAVHTAQRPPHQLWAGAAWAHRAPVVPGVSKKVSLGLRRVAHVLVRVCRSWSSTRVKRSRTLPPATRKRRVRKGFRPLSAGTR